MIAPSTVPNSSSDIDALLDDLLTDDPAWHQYIHTRTPHDRQREFIQHPAKRKVIRAGRRGGKTTGIAILALEAFKAGKRVLYATPTAEQVDAFWYEVTAACADAIERKLLYKNEQRHIIEVPGTKARIRAKTAWNADSLRGDYGDLLIFDEYQLMNEDTWGSVGAPMLMDNNGDAVFIYTPPSHRSRAVTKANDPQHAPKLFKQAQADTSGLWATFHFSSRENPHISAEAIELIAHDMTAVAYRQEIEAEDLDEAPGALWGRAQLDALRMNAVPDGVDLRRVVVGVDPPGGRTECGIVVSALGSDDHVYVLADYSQPGSPDTWGSAVVGAYHEWDADLIVAEKNYGGDMVEHVLKTADTGGRIRFRLVTATRGKAVRAEPVAAIYERGQAHHVGTFPHMEDEMTGWQPDSNMPSPNRMDALVWTVTELKPPRARKLTAQRKPDILRLKP